MSYKLQGELLEGKKFASLTVIRWNKANSSWVCRCDCGNEVYKRGYELRKMQHYRCKCSEKKRMEEKYLPLVGTTKDRLTVVSYEFINKPILNCKCSCGKERKFLASDFKDAKSCGCLKFDNILINNPRPRPKLEGRKFGFLTVKEWVSKRASWLCECRCGSKTFVTSQRLQDRHTKSCGCLRTELSKLTSKDLIGKKHGYLKCIDYNHDKVNKKYILTCKCKCGEITFVDKNKWGTTKSCGCLRLEIKGERRWNASLSNKEALMVRTLYRSKSGFNLEVLAEMFSVSVLTISRLINDKIYKDVE